jgi:arabinose-5-phosphate isomerase
VPQASADAPLADAVVAMSRGGLGLIAVIENDRVAGIFTDGDLRRAFERGIDLRHETLGAVMTARPRTIGGQRLAVEAVEMMERHKINALLVVDDDGRLLGALNMHDLFRARVI